MTPANQNRATIIAASKHGARLFRMFVGLGWVGSRVKKHDKSEMFFCPSGSITILDPRPIKPGIPGMSDSFGWSKMLVTQEMVGAWIAVPTAVEDKSGSGRLSPEQRAFLIAVLAVGGRAGVARCDDDVEKIVTGKVVGLGLK